MRKIKSIAALLLTALFACNNSATREETQSKVDSSSVVIDSLKPIADKKPAPDSSKTVTAKFVEFVLGDVTHYMFKDDMGTTWDFRNNLDNNYKFEMELPKNKINETNQGYGSNKNLQGKFFVISYILTAEAEQPDEEGGKVKVITHITPK